MSRFNYPKALPRTPAQTLPLPAQPASTPPPPAVSAAASRLSLVLEPSVSDAGLLQRAGFGLMCIFVLSGYANEFAMRYFHVKAYISTVSWVLLPILLVLSGNLLRGLRDITGRLWLLFLACMAFAIPFSVWKGGSVALLLTYVPHDWIQLFYYAGFLISFRHCRTFLHFLIASNMVLLLDCFLFGAVREGRFDIPQSIFFTNPNDLALQLLIALTQFLYLLQQRQAWKNALGAGGILIGLLYLFKTGSRGAFLAAVVLAIVSIALGKNRGRLLLVAGPVVVAALILAPSAAFHRLTLIELEPVTASITERSDLGAVASQVQRVALLRQSINYAVTHPLLGVGPGQFAVAAFGDSEKAGTRANWLGTHNSYTQVASECGIPAFLLYAGVIGISLVSNFRLYRRTPRTSEYRDLSAIAFCFFSGTLVYAICTFFFHIAYSAYLPQLAGMTIALRLGTKSSLWSSKGV